MKKLLFLTIVLAFTLLSRAQLFTQHTHSSNFVQNTRSQSLYEQILDPRIISGGVVSTECSDLSDCKTGIADDFTVTGNGWEITSIEVQGSVTTIEPPSFTIRLLEDNSGMPSNTVLFTQSQLPYSQNANTYSITLSQSIQLDPGVYWLQVLGHSTSSTFWYWDFVQTYEYDNPAYIEDPCSLFGGFSWAEVTTKLTGMRDTMFVLYGTEVEATPVSNWAVIFGLALITLAFIFTFLKARIKPSNDF